MGPSPTDGFHHQVGALGCPATPAVEPFRGPCPNPGVYPVWCRVAGGLPCHHHPDLSTDYLNQGPGNILGLGCSTEKQPQMCGRTSTAGFQSHFIYKAGGQASGRGLLAAGLDQQAEEGMAGSQGLFLVSPAFPTQTSHSCADTGQKRGEAVRARQPLQRSWRQ